MARQCTPLIGTPGEAPGERPRGGAAHGPGPLQTRSNATGTPQPCRNHNPEGTLYLAPLTSLTLPEGTLSSPLSDIAWVEGTYIVLHILPYLQITFPKDIPGG